MLWDFKYGRGGDCAFYILVFIFPQQHNTSPHSSWKVIPFLISLSALLQTHMFSGQGFFCAWVGAWTETSQWLRKLVWPLFRCPASATHILLTISSQSPATSCFIIIIMLLLLLLFCCFFFSQKHSVKFKLSFHIPKALLSMNFIVDSFSLHFFTLNFPGSFSFSEEHLTLSGCF